MNTIKRKRAFRFFAPLLASTLFLTPGFHAPMQTANAATNFDVSTYGAVGDGVTDDGPAIDQAIQAAVAATGTKTVVFDTNKTYRIGDNPNNWRYFRILGASDLTLQGNGSTLLFTPGNYPFYIKQSTNVSIQDLSIDYGPLTITQGSVVATNSANYSFDVQIESGYPTPPTDTFVLANQGSYPGTGGNHGLLYEATDFVRKSTPIDHFEIKSITDQGGGVYRFVLDDSYQSNMSSIAANDRFVYNFANLKLTKDQMNAKVEWIKDTNANDYNGSILYTPAVDNSASASFSGTQISYVARKGPDMGMANVYIDGALVASNVDLYSATPQYQSVVYTNSSLSNTSHTIMIKATGTKNPLSSGTKMSVDYFGAGATKIDSSSLSLKSYTFGVANFDITESSNVTLQGINSYASIGKFARVYNNTGTVAFNGVNVKIKPGTDRLLANGSDVIHAKNNRGSIVIENCYFEAANDDLTNISSMAFNVSSIVSSNQVVLKSTDNFYYDYDIEPNDVISFTDFAHNTVVGNRTVTAVTRLDYGKYQITLDQPITGIAQGTKAWDLNQTNPNSTIEHSTFRPVLRQAMLTRMNGGAISNNTIQGLGGYGIRLSDAANEGFLAKGVTINQNTFDKVGMFGISMSSELKDFENLHDANILIENNTMTNHNGNGIILANVKDVTLSNNSISMDSAAPSGKYAVNLNNTRDINISGMAITDPRSGTGSAIYCTYCESSTVHVAYDKMQVAAGVLPYQFTEKVDDAYASVAYTGTWSVQNDASDYESAMHYSGSAGAYAAFTFDGTSVQYAAKKGPGAGIADIYLDGVLIAGGLDLYQASPQYQAVVYQNNALTYGRHTLKIMATGTKNAASTGAAVNVDSIQYGSQAVRADNTDAAVTYSGTWAAQNGLNDYNATMKYCATANSYAQFTFTGTSIAYGVRKGPGAGIADVYVDGTLVADNLDLYAPGAEFQSIAYRNDALPYGSHTIKIVATGTKNAASTGSAVNVDFFDYR